MSPAHAVGIDGTHRPDRTASCDSGSGEQHPFYLPRNLPEFLIAASLSVCPPIAFTSSRSIDQEFRSRDPSGDGPCQTMLSSRPIRSLIAAPSGMEFSTSSSATGGTCQYAPQLKHARACRIAVQNSRPAQSRRCGRQVARVRYGSSPACLPPGHVPSSP